MEVHHHPDLHHKKKPWKEYLLEFIMIFLAVTLGFFAESLREHISEKDRAQAFGQSLIEDFTTDTTSLHQLIDFSTTKIKEIDSLDICIHTPKGGCRDSLLYLRVLYLISTFQMDNINGAYEQIKSSGSLRYFDQALVNNMNAYDATAAKLKLMEDLENKFLFEKVNPQAQTMFNYTVFEDLRNGKPIQHKIYFKNMNEESVDVLVNQASLIKRLRERQLNQQRILLQKAELILSGLKKDR